MGYGDELMATGMARGLAARGKQAAFGDGRRIIFSPQSREIFWGNPNIAYPGQEREPGLVWIPHYRGRRLYARQVDGHWLWNESFRAVPGEIHLTPTEIQYAENFDRGFVVIEPNVKATAYNKQWPVVRYQEVANKIRRTHRVVQFPGPHVLRGVEVIQTGTFRQAMAVLANAALFVGPEGGLHHAAAAVHVRAVVIFGGFIHPRTTGYSSHANIFKGERACGTIGRRCPHCADAMRRISIQEVMRSVEGELDR